MADKLIYGSKYTISPEDARNDDGTLSQTLGKGLVDELAMGGVAAKVGVYFDGDTVILKRAKQALEG